MLSFSAIDISDSRIICAFQYGTSVELGQFRLYILELSFPGS